MIKIFNKKYNIDKNTPSVLLSSGSEFKKDWYIIFTSYNDYLWKYDITKLSKIDVIHAHFIFLERDKVLFFDFLSYILCNGARYVGIREGAKFDSSGKFESKSFNVHFQIWVYHW